MSDREPQPVGLLPSTDLVTDSGPLTTGVVTGIGSLPHFDAGEAAEFVLEHTPELPAVPQLPNRSPHEQMITQWARALPEVRVDDDGRIERRSNVAASPPHAEFDDRAHGGLLSFVEVARRSGLPAVKVQLTGPLTLGMALHTAGFPTEQSFSRASECATAWARALCRLLATELPGAAPLVVFDEPALVAWERDRAPLGADSATDLLSGALASIPTPGGVHVCGEGHLGIATGAGPTVLFCEPRACTPKYASAVARHVSAGGWVGWGAVPTDRPIGDSIEPAWRDLGSAWQVLDDRGVARDLLIRRSLVSPACGLAGHGVSQAEHVLMLAGRIGARLRERFAST